MELQALLGGGGVMADIVISLPNLEGRAKFLEKDIRQAIGQAATMVRHHLITQWLKARGGDEIPMKSLSPRYAEKKNKSGRMPIPNLSYTGELQKSLQIIRQTNTSATVGFIGSRNTNVARGNVKLRENMMDLSQNIHKQVVDLIADRLKASK